MHSLRCRKPDISYTIGSSWPVPGHDLSHAESFRHQTIRENPHHGHSQPGLRAALVQTAKLCSRWCIQHQDRHCRRRGSRAAKLSRDTTHPNDHLFTRQRSGKHFCRLSKRNDRLWSFISTFQYNCPFIQNYGPRCDVTALHSRVGVHGTPTWLSGDTAATNWKPTTAQNPLTPAETSRVEEFRGAFLPTTTVLSCCFVRV